jgi:NDP-sugar pyrophosphorylase family protein
MKAMILTAGLGTRLRPLTLERAKPTIPLLGKPLVVRLITKLMKEGATGFRLNLHHLPHTIESIFQSIEWGAMPVSFSHELQILGTAGGLKANESYFDDDTFLMVNGDIVMDFPLKEALAFHKENKPLATLILYPQAEPYRYSPIRIDEVGRLRNFKGARPGGKLRPETYVFTGAHILEPDIFSLIPPGVPWEINDQVYPKALDAGAKILGFPVEGYWSDLGNPPRYLGTQRELLMREGTTPPQRISDRAGVSVDNFIGPFVSIGENCVVEVGASIENSILWENVRVKKNCVVRNCIIGSDVTIDRDCSDVVITRNGEAPIG